MIGKAFALGDVLSITSGQLVSRDHIEGVYRILNFMTGDNLMTHQLPRAMEECRPSLLAQHPQVNGVSLPERDGDWTKEEVYAWLDEQESRFGATLPVRPLDAADHTHIDPISELRMMKPDAQIVVLSVDDE